MFTLGIYDTLTPGSLTDGRTIAGTGTIDATGTVGPIGGIQQKIVGARDAGAELFLVPPDNCDEAVLAPQRGHAAGPGAHHAQRPRVDRGVGRGPRRRPARRCEKGAA